MRYSSQSLEDETGLDTQISNMYSVSGVIINHIVKILLIYFFYFYKGELNFTKIIGARLIFAVLINAFLIYHYIKNRETLSLFWGPFLVEEIVMDLVGSCAIMFYAW